MNNIEMNSYFKNQFLTSGQTYGKHIITNVPTAILEQAPQIINNSNKDHKACNIILTREEEKQIEKTLYPSLDKYTRTILARDYICAIIYRELSRIIDISYKQLQIVDSQLEAFTNNNLGLLKELHSTSLMPNNIVELIKKEGNIDLNLFLHSTQNIDIQRAFNIFMSSRVPFSIKIFTNNEKIPSYTDSLGTLIECPHDYTSTYANKYIETHHQNEM